MTKMSNFRIRLLHSLKAIASNLDLAVVISFVSLLISLLSFLYTNIYLVNNLSVVVDLDDLMGSELALEDPPPKDAEWTFHTKLNLSFINNGNKSIGISRLKYKYKTSMSGIKDCSEIAHSINSEVSDFDPITIKPHDVASKSYTASSPDYDEVGAHQKGSSFTFCIAPVITVVTYSGLQEFELDWWMTRIGSIDPEVGWTLEKGYDDRKTFELVNTSSWFGN